MSSAVRDSRGAGRYERKLVALGPLTEEVERLVKGHPAHFVEEYPARWVNNVYFDGPRFQAVRDHAAGVEHRTKTRIRWYGPVLTRVGHPVLEQKKKRGLLGTKLRDALAPLDTREGITRSVLTSALAASDLPANLRSWFRSAYPVLVNRYRRRYLRSSDGRFRLTVDGAVAYDTVAPHARGARFLVDRERTILELKYAPDVEGFAGDVATRLRLRVGKSSKLMRGLCLLRPELSV